MRGTAVEVGNLEKECRMREGNNYHQNSTNWKHDDVSSGLLEELVQEIETGRCTTSYFNNPFTQKFGGSS